MFQQNSYIRMSETIVKAVRCNTFGGDLTRDLVRVWEKIGGEGWKLVAVLVFLEGEH